MKALVRVVAILAVLAITQPRVSAQEAGITPVASVWMSAYLDEATTHGDVPGLVAGVGLVELVASKAPDAPFFRNPQVDLRVMLVATVMITLAGLLAGFIPARRAARVNPIEALRDG